MINFTWKRLTNLQFAVEFEKFEPSWYRILQQTVDQLGLLVSVSFQELDSRTIILIRFSEDNYSDLPPGVTTLLLCNMLGLFQQKLHNAIRSRYLLQEDPR